MAAILAVSKYIKDPEIIQNGLETFQPLEHRMEFVTSINGIRFYNDSKATNTDAVHFALNSFDERVNIILGGSDKGEDFGVLAKDLNKNADKIFLIGATKEKMLKDFLMSKEKLFCVKTLKNLSQKLMICLKKRVLFFFLQLVPALICLKILNIVERDLKK